MAADRQTSLPGPKQRDLFSMNSLKILNFLKEIGLEEVLFARVRGIIDLYGLSAQTPNHNKKTLT